MGDLPVTGWHLPALARLLPQAIPLVRQPGQRTTRSTPRCGSYWRDEVNAEDLPIVLKWSEPKPPSEDCRYDHIVAQTAFGRLTIEWKSWKQYDCACLETPWGYIMSSTIEECKAGAIDDLRERIASVLAT